MDVDGPGGGDGFVLGSIFVKLPSVDEGSVISIATGAMRGYVALATKWRGGRREYGGVSSQEDYI